MKKTKTVKRDPLDVIFTALDTIHEEAALIEEAAEEIRLRPCRCQREE